MLTVNGLFFSLRAGGVMVYPLLALSAVATLVAIDKFYVFNRRARVSPRLIDLIETYGFAWEELSREVGALTPQNCFRRFFAAVLDNRARSPEWVESRATDRAGVINQDLGRRLWVLETIVTAAPLLGLLGTITGMIRAFKLFGDRGLVDPVGVTGGVAEALIATALGLFVALIALFAFNYLSQRQAEIMAEMERLGTMLIDRLRLDTGEASA